MCNCFKYFPQIVDFGELFLILSTLELLLRHHQNFFMVVLVIKKRGEIGLKEPLATCSAQD